jgi:hypothetical protein
MKKSAVRFSVWVTFVALSPLAPRALAAPPVAMPEGGTSWMYLLPAGLCCLGAILLRSNRKAGARESN